MRAGVLCLGYNRDMGANVTRGTYLWGTCNLCMQIGRLYKDHCHAHNQMRGLLCNMCNTRRMPKLDMGQGIQGIACLDVSYIAQCGPCVREPIDPDKYVNPSIRGWLTGVDAYRNRRA